MEHLPIRNNKIPTWAEIPYREFLKTTKKSKEELSELTEELLKFKGQKLTFQAFPTRYIFISRKEPGQLEYDQGQFCASSKDVRIRFNYLNVDVINFLSENKESEGKFDSLVVHKINDNFEERYDIVPFKNITEIYWP